MAKKDITMINWLQISSLRLARVRFFFILLFAAVIIAADAWKLIPPEVVLDRWTVAGLALAVNAIIWYFSRSGSQKESFYKGLIFTQIILDIAVASFLIYSQRGVASNAVMLYALPLIVSAVLLSRAALFATAFLSVATYAMVTVRYAITYPGEGYRVELYSELAFYGGIFFVIAALLNALVHSRK